MVKTYSVFTRHANVQHAHQARGDPDQLAHAVSAQDVERANQAPPKTRWSISSCNTSGNWRTLALAVKVSRANFVTSFA